MRRWISTGALTATAVVATLASASAGFAQGSGGLDLYTARMDAGAARDLARGGADVVAERPRAGGAVDVDIVLSPGQRARLVAQGIRPTLKRDGQGRSQAQRAAAQAAGGYNVWRSWDEPGGIRDETLQVARDNRDIVRREVLGRTYNGREIVALRVAGPGRGRDERDDRGRGRDDDDDDDGRPAVLYSSLQHAREWISGEVNRRLLHHVIDGYRAGDRQIRTLLRSTDLYFVLVANPDGYQYTFDSERLWRKNLRDNNGDGMISTGDGVDPNRNFNEHWKYDGEGSSSLTSAETYRGPSAGSEPETQAMQGLIKRVKPKFQSNLHSYGPFILFPQGWQTGSPDADNPIYAALAGTDARPGIPGFDPGISSDELYVTNGETTDFADVNAGTVAFTPELEEGAPGAGFVFPDDEALVQAEFEKTLPFHMALARSATRPSDPVSPVGATLKPFYLDQADVDPENAALSMLDFRFSVSYGDPQDVRVLARRDLGRVRVRYQINGGPTRSASTSEWTAGKRYGVGNANYYRVMRGFVRGTDPGDTVKVWFEGGDDEQRSESFTYKAVSESNRKVLIMAAEDYTGASPVYPPGPSAPRYLSYYTSALSSNGIGYDVYDVDANARTAPDALGVLSHYRAVVWYTGDDVITREPGWGPGNASRLAQEELFEVRDFLNEGGRLLYTGKYAGVQYAAQQLYDPFANRQCSSDPAVLETCRSLGGVGDGVNDVMEYWFGASIVNDNAGTDPVTGDVYDVLGTDTPLAGVNFGFNGADSAGNQSHSDSFITTSGLLPAAQYPQFRSWVAGKYDRPGGPFEPHSGSGYVYSQIGDVSYKRLMRTIDVPAGGADMSFWTSYAIEAGWDEVFVEAHTVGQDDWTTLPDVNGHTSSATGDSCPAGWRDLHPQLDHYQTLNPDSTCSPTGTTGAWNAATGNSGGWQQWKVDLGAYAGKQVEISISYVSDWATQGLGVFVDDIAVSTGSGSTSFETGLDGWTVPGAPAGSSTNPNDFIRTSGAGFPEGAVVATDDTLMFGFGVEGITGQAARTEVMGRAMGYLLR